MTYVDGFVIPVPTDKIEAYRSMADKAKHIWLEYGALDYKECVAEDTSNEFGHRDFTEMAGVKKGETVVFSYIVYTSREHRDEVNKKVMADERIKGACENMPFDVKRMAYGGFKTIVE